MATNKINCSYWSLLQMTYQEWTDDRALATAIGVITLQKKNSWG